MSKRIVWIDPTRDLPIIALCAAVVIGICYLLGYDEGDWKMAWGFLCGQVGFLWMLWGRHKELTRAAARNAAKS